MTISVIIPTLNEAQGIAMCIAQLRRQHPREILVVDGGSSDATWTEAQGADRVLHGPRGRAAQMNHGAAQARGEILLFLHADCRLQDGSLDAVRACLQRPRVVAGCFRMRVAAPGLLYRSIDFFATLRVQWTGIIYGDQGVFVRRRDFERWGGFPPLRLMEDVFFSLRVRRQGRVVVVPYDIEVSARRWAKVGVVRQTLRNWTLTALAAAGVNPNRLAAFYPHVR